MTVCISSPTFHPFVWRVIQTKAREEFRVADRLRAVSFDVYVPVIKQKISIFGKLRQQILPLFPRYIFVRCPLNVDIGLIRWAVGVKSVVSFNGIPAVLDDEIVDFIRHQEDETGVIKTSGRFRPNQKVIVSSGPLKDIQGVFLKQLKGPDRVLVLMMVMGCSTHIQLDSALLIAG